MKDAVNCPNDHGEMSLKRVEKQKTFREIDVKYWAETYVCDECGISVGTIQQAAAIQNAIADAYREAKGLLTGKEIKRKRKELGWTQKELARKAGVGVVSIKRWENGIIQTRSMNYSKYGKLLVVHQKSRMMKFGPGSGKRWIVFSTTEGSF